MHKTGLSFTATCDNRGVTYTPKHREHRTRRAIKRHYTEILPVIREVARKCGYAIAVQGSMTRDFDLVAVPWSSKFLHRETLVLRIEKAICEYRFIRTVSELRKIQKSHAHQEKHGNVGEGFVVMTGADTYLDMLVIIPRHPRA